jgi:YVTN family beta-propeller protein
MHFYSPKGTHMAMLIVKQFIAGTAITCAILVASAAVVSAADAPPGKAAHTNPGAYHILRKIPVAGGGRWDLLDYDAEGNRIFIPRATRYQVVDANKGVLLGEIPDTPGAHGVAFDYKHGKGYTSNGRDNSVTVFDLKTLKTLSKIKVGESPDAMVMDSFTKTLFVFNGKSSDVSVIDPANDTVIATITLSGKPELCASDGKGTIYVNLEDKSEIARIDAAKHTVTAVWPLLPGTEPSGLAIDPKTNRLFSACDNKLLVVVDSENGKVVTTVPIGEGPDGAVFDAEKRLIFVPNGKDGTLSIIREVSPKKFTVEDTLPTQRGAKTIALNPKAHVVYVPAAEFETLAPDQQNTRKRPDVKPGSFEIFIIGAK